MHSEFDNWLSHQIVSVTKRDISQQPEAEKTGAIIDKSSPKLFEDNPGGAKSFN